MLLRAAKDGNVAEIKRLLREGGATAPAPAPAPAVSLVNSRGMWDTPALVFACQYGRAAAALELLRHGADARLANARGGTALLYACVESAAADMAEVAVALIAAGVDVEAPPVRVYDSLIDRATQHTPLTAAASRLSAEAVMEQLQNAGVPAGVAQHVEDLVRRDPQLAARDFFEEIEHRDGGRVRASRPGFRLQETGGRTTDTGRSIGADNERVLAQWLGFSADDIDHHRRAGILEQ